jgi:hypothetical protein
MRDISCVLKVLQAGLMELPDILDVVIGEQMRGLTGMESHHSIGMNSISRGNTSCGGIGMYRGWLSERFGEVRGCVQN